jgi:glycosyltransferase involved in cell wall biosynthesis
VKLAIITCYKDPDYVRARSLRAALATLPDVETIVIKNRHQGILKYPEVLIKTVRARWHQKPDAYLLTFRGYELLPAVLLITLGKPLIFDEFINPLEVVAEHRQQKDFLTSTAMSLWTPVGWLYYRLLRGCRIVLTDTPAHATFTAQLSGLNPNKYASIAVGADETVFKPRQPKPIDTKRFRVLFYGSMLPLHGLKYVLQAAEQLKTNPVIQFLIIGGNKAAAKQVATAQKRGANIEYRPWVDFAEIPILIAQTDLCLAGPFGNTVQSQYVINGRTFQLLASQAPVVVGKINNGSEINGLLDKQTCLVVPQGDAKAIAQAIIWAQAKPQELSKIAESGRILFENRFSAQVLGQQLQKLLRNV